MRCLGVLRSDRGASSDTRAAGEKRRTPLFCGGSFDLSPPASPFGFPDQNTSSLPTVTLVYAAAGHLPPISWSGVTRPVAAAQ